MCHIGKTWPLQSTNTATLRETGDWANVLHDGSIWYLGRKDDQIKRHGKRINLLEIEQVRCIHVVEIV